MKPFTTLDINIENKKDLKIGDSVIYLDEITMTESIVTITNQSQLEQAKQDDAIFILKEYYDRF